MLITVRCLCLLAPILTLLAQNQEPVLRITVNLVQVDAVVIDSSGHQVTNLGAGDFEVLEDGLPQKITACSYVKIADASLHSVKPHSTAREPVPSDPPAIHIKQVEVRRTVVLLVDDLGLSFQSTARVRRALHKFVDQQMQPGDLVAVIRTRGGMGALEQFTADKRILHAAIDHVQWFVSGGRSSTFEPIGYDYSSNASTMTMSHGGQRQTNTTGPPQGGGNYKGPTFAAGTLGSINFVIRALREMPGRKAVILFSDGIPALTSSLTGRLIQEGLQQLADLANRSAVVLYTVDARALQTFGLTAADDTNPKGESLTTTELAGVSPRREHEYLASEDGLEYLARETGGFFMHDRNDLDAGIIHALEDMSGYYLVGYKPSESSFELESGERRFHRIRVLVKQAGLSVRSRTGYIGIPDEKARQINQTPAGQLNAALNSPFDSAGLNVRLTCLYSEEPRSSAAIRMLLDVDARDLSYSDQPDGTRIVAVDVAAFALGERGAIAGSNDRAYRIRLSPEEYQAASSGGLVFKLNVNLAKPGAYQMRVAVRDAASGKIGSASQFVEVPDFQKRRLALSGIIMNGPQVEGTSRGWEASNKDYGIAAPGTAAMRVFHPGDPVSFAYVIFDARPEPKTGHPKVETQFSLYRDGLRIYSSPITPANSKQTDATHLVATGTLLLGSSLEPGEYMFQAIARDPRAPHKYQMAWQWTDIELVK
jgi:VWFA-related protein